MGIFGGDKWRDARDDLAKAAKGAKEMIPHSVDDSVRLLFGVGPTDKKAYQPYLDYLSKGNVPDELKKLPPDVVDACALQLLCIATNKLELILPGWSVSITSLALDELTPSALPLLKQLTGLLVEQKQWQILLDYTPVKFRLSQ